MSLKKDTIGFHHTLFFARCKPRLPGHELLAPALAVEGDGETVRLAVGKQDLFLETLGERFLPDETLWLMLGIFHDPYDRNRQAKRSQHFCRDIVLEERAIHHDDFRERPLAMFQAPLQNFFQRREIIAVMRAAQNEFSVRFFIGLPALYRNHHSNTG